MKVYEINVRLPPEVDAEEFAKAIQIADEELFGGLGTTGLTFHDVDNGKGTIQLTAQADERRQRALYLLKEVLEYYGGIEITEITKGGEWLSKMLHGER